MKRRIFYFCSLLALFLLIVVPIGVKAADVTKMGQQVVFLDESGNAMKNPTAGTIRMGKETTFFACATNNAGQQLADLGAVHYQSSDTTVAVVEESTGKITPVNPGRCIIIAWAEETDRYYASEKVMRVLEVISSSDSNPGYDNTTTRSKQVVAFNDSESKHSIIYGDTMTVYAEARGETNSTVGVGRIHYLSTDTTVATIDETTGAVTTLKSGTFSIIAYAEENEKFHESEKVKWSVTVNKAKPIIQTAKEQYIFSITDTNEQDLGINISHQEAVVTITSSNLDVLTIANDGKVNVRGAGEAEVTIRTAEDNKFTANERTVHVRVEKKIPTINYISYFEKTTSDGVFSLEATCPDGELFYSTDSAGIKVYSDGQCVPVAAGSHEVIIEFKETSKYQAVKKVVTIKVTEAVHDLVYSPYYEVNMKDKEFSLDATCSTGTITYKSTNEDIIKVFDTGDVKLIGPGIAVINLYIAKTDKYPEMRKDVTVTVVKDKHDLQVNAHFDVSIDDSKFNLRASSGTGTITYSTPDVDKIILTETGDVTPIGAGKATVYVMVAGTDEYAQALSTVTITISKAVQEIHIPYIAYTKRIGDVAFNLNISVTPSGLLPTYTSNKPSVAHVGLDGLVTVGNPGVAIITVSLPETAKYPAVSKDITIQVLDKSTQTINVKSSTINKYPDSEPFFIGATCSSGNLITYSSSNDSIASVSSSGYVTIYKSGTVKIYITAAESEEFKEAHKTIKLVIGKKNQKLKVKDCKTKVTLGDAPVKLKVSSNSKTSKIKYKSSNTKIAKVSSSGVVTFVKPGKATITITGTSKGAYEEASTQVVFTVRPKKVTDIYIERLGVTKMNVEFEKVKGATGYKIEYCRNKHFEGCLTVTTRKDHVTLKKLKDTTYYVRIRPYVTVNGKKIYGAYSYTYTVD